MPWRNQCCVGALARSAALPAMASPSSSSTPLSPFTMVPIIWFASEAERQHECRLVARRFFRSMPGGGSTAAANAATSSSWAMSIGSGAASVLMSGGAARAGVWGRGRDVLGVSAREQGAHSTLLPRRTPAAHVWVLALAPPAVKEAACESRS